MPGAREAQARKMEVVRTNPTPRMFSTHFASPRPRRV